MKTNMIMKTLIVTALLLLTRMGFAQENVTYQKPPKEIMELVDYERAPSVMRDSKNEYLLFTFRNTYKNLEDLSQEELKLAGLRINPITNISSTITYVNNLKIRKFKGTELLQVAGLPANPKIAFISWSPNEKKIAFTHTSSSGVELWVLDVLTASAKKITEGSINANLGYPYVWMKDNESLLVKMLPREQVDLVNTAEVLPSGPIVSVSNGSKAQNRTYQDLLKNKVDEQNFETLISTEIFSVKLDGSKTVWQEVGMWSYLSVSPDGTAIMASKIQKPFSYLVQYNRFAYTSTVFEQGGALIKEVNNVPLLEVLPKGTMAVRKGKRDMTWRSDKGSTLCFVEALDDGDPEKKVEFRDELFEWASPFSKEPLALMKTQQRFEDVTWGNDQLAIVEDRWWNTRNTKTYTFNPSKPEVKPKVIFDRDYQDAYSNPGSFDLIRNQYGKHVLNLVNSDCFLLGEGFTEKGQFPFVDQLNLVTGKKTRIYQSASTTQKETLISMIHVEKGEILVRLESSTDYPNYYVRNYKKKNAPVQITFFENPFKSIQNVTKEVIKYKREDGIELSGTLYLPIGYDKTKKEKKPMIMWAYPQEFKDKNSAGQNTSNPNEFTFPFYGSPIYWVTRGYLVLDDAAFPILGEGDTEPNDSFLPQLVSNAKAAIDAVDSLGFIDRSKVAIGGHSYGAFMTANLLTHSDLFACGVARSGAYNRTLTPFGFQSEERSYWDVPNVYNTMSPFMTADKMKTPLLLIHGEADNNPGTFTLQSERYFHALKGMGNPARLVILPKESHGYAAKENIMHLLWEQDQWFERYLMGK
jgi:dipeptidyl aminopeptidase/acylaminoacyl peptidase